MHRYERHGRHRDTRVAGLGVRDVRSPLFSTKIAILATRPPSMTVERPTLHVNIQTEKAQSIAVVPIGDMSVLKAYVHMQFRNCKALTVANKMYT